jgi:uncharacterized protein YgbK (DUF1537 family)
VLRDSLPAASEVFAALPPARHDGAALRAEIRALREADGLLLGVLDDDPTGSQSVHGVQVVTVPEEDSYQAAFASGADTCFVLTNTRSRSGRDAAALNALTAHGLSAVARRRGVRLQLISRSDSTLRGHVLAEVTALQAARAELSGRGYDGVLLVPAFLEAGRVTAGDIHWARAGGELVPVGETEYARDAAFGYASSDLRDFVAEKSGGTVRARDVRSIGLADIRLGGPARVAGLLAGVRDGAWVAVNATEYSDLEAVACGVLLAERAGRSFLFRTGPSFVRALSGLEPKPPLRGPAIVPPGGPAGHGLIVAGSHVSTTSRQLAALTAGGRTASIELDAAAAAAAGADGADGAGGVAADAGARAAAALARSDVLLYTSRTVVAGSAGADSLTVARRVSGALARAVRLALAGRPAWVVAKGGITSHDVAVHGLGIRRAEVAGQLFPGLISVLWPVDAASEAIGMPYVVFAGNVGDDQTLRQVVAILNGEREES